MPMTREELIEKLKIKLVDGNWSELIDVAGLCLDHLQSSHEAELMAFAEHVAKESCLTETSRDVPYCHSHHTPCPCIAQRARELLNKIKDPQ